MNISNLLYAQLTSDTAVMGHLGERIYPNVLPQDDVAFDRVSYEPEAVYITKEVPMPCDGQSISTSNITIMVFATVKDTTIIVAEAVKACLENWTAVHQCVFVSANDDYDEIMGVPYQVLEFEVIY